MRERVMVRGRVRGRFGIWSAAPKGLGGFALCVRERVMVRGRVRVRVRG